jgi:hypothetical protein
VLEMDNQGSNYFIAAVQFSNGSQGIYSNVMDMESIFTKSSSENQLDFRIDEGETYNIIDDSNIDDISTDPAFQRIASNIICSELDNYGFKVCQQGLTTNPPATSTSVSGTGQIDMPPLSTDDDDSNGNDDEDNDNDNGDNDDND